MLARNKHEKESEEDVVSAVYPDSLPDPLGQAVRLLVRSKLHRAWTVDDVRRLIEPPLRERQCLFFWLLAQICG